MTKRIRKPTGLQKNKDVINLAMKMKKLGLLSKQTNLHGGRYVSAAVARKVVDNQYLANLNYTAVKATRAQVKAAKERGFETIGNKIIGPNEPYFKKRVKSGELTGVVPVKGGALEKVILPHTVFDMRSLLEQVETGIDSYKLPDELFAFEIYGRESLQTFLYSKDMLDYLLRYQSVNNPEENDTLFDNFSIVRLHYSESRKLVPFKWDAARTDRNREWRAKGINQPKPRVNATGRNVAKVKPSKYENMHPHKARVERERARKKIANWRDDMKINDPVRYAAYKKKALERYYRNKNKGK